MSQEAIEFADSNCWSLLDVKTFNLKSEFAVCFLIAVRTGLEPVTSGVTGRHSKPTGLTHHK